MFGVQHSTNGLHGSSTTVGEVDNIVVDSVVGLGARVVVGVLEGSVGMLVVVASTMVVVDEAVVVWTEEIDTPSGKHLT